jgi:long-subunit fatty acid transport protein
MFLPLISGHKVRCLVPSCGKRVSRNRSGNYSGHKWGSSELNCPGGGTPAFEVNDRVSFNVGVHAVYGTITWLGWDTTGTKSGAVATIKVDEGDEITRRTSLLGRAGRAE